MSKFYAGVGARTTPSEICATMSALATKLYNEDWTLRSGGASGADQAFEQGSRGDHEIYLANPAIYTPELWEAASLISEQCHPAWNRCSQKARQLHTRNVFQILGDDLETPSKFVLCWTPGARVTGGTGQTIRIAASHGVPVFNLADPDTYLRLTKWVSPVAD